MHRLLGPTHPARSARTKEESSLPNDQGNDMDSKEAVVIASDMYTLIADRVTRAGLVIGYLSQQHQFSCIASNRGYDYVSAIAALDGILVSGLEDADSSTVRDGGRDNPGRMIESDWLYLQQCGDIDAVDPLARYMHLAGKYNDAMLTQPAYVHPPQPVGRDLGERMGGKGSSNSTISTTSSVTSASSTKGDGGSGRDGSIGRHSPSTAPSGWCSWYHYFEKITEADLINNISAMRELKERHGMCTAGQGFSLFQIDDGYQRAWGDWLHLDEKKFPSGSLTAITDLVRGAGMTAGLWLAPFSCDKHSHIVLSHPEWIARHPSGLPANSANCGKWFYGLDTTNPGVRQYLSHVLDVVVLKWGFTYLKLDFLYSAILPPAHSSSHDRSKTRATILSEAMCLISERVNRKNTASETGGPQNSGRVFILGCGAPLGAMIGHVHANRVSPDAGLSWLPEWPLPGWDKWNLPSARGMIRNTLARLPMHGRWWINDPDCMLLRTSTHFSDREILSIATVKALSGGSFILSDDLVNVPVHRLRVAQQLLPTTNLSCVSVDSREREMPELLRLSLSRGEDALGGYDGNDGASSWTLFATCYWSERDYAYTELIGTGAAATYTRGVSHSGSGMCRTITRYSSDEGCMARRHLVPLQHLLGKHTPHDTPSVSLLSDPLYLGLRW